MLQIWRGAKEPSGEMSSALIQDLFNDADVGKILINMSSEFAASANRRVVLVNCQLAVGQMKANRG